MKKFSFRLEPLLSLRLRREEEVKHALGRKNNEIAAVRAAIVQLDDEFRRMQATEKKKRSEVRNAQELRYSTAYRFKLRGDIRERKRALIELNRQAEEIRKQLVAAKRDRRAVEIIRERRFGEWRHDYNQQEQKFVDEVSRQGFIRNGKARESG